MAAEGCDVTAEGWGRGVREDEIVGGWYIVYQELLLLAEYLSWC
jgi:hypothetical protein